MKYVFVLLCFAIVVSVHVRHGFVVYLTNYSRQDTAPPSDVCVRYHTEKQTEGVTLELPRVFKAM